MNQLLIAGFMIAALSSGAMAKAKNAPVVAPAHHLKTSMKRVDDRAEKTKRYIAADLHRRGSDIPPAFSPTGHWSR